MIHMPTKSVQVSHKGVVTVVVPVYADWGSLNECIESLKRYMDKKHLVMFVNDCGPNADMIEKNIRKSIKGLENFKYYRNPKNLGFVKTCNLAALELDKSGNDILLLNSDTKATKGFLQEMLDVLYSSDKIAAVCPRSNNATIFSMPVDAQEKGVGMQDSYRIFKKISKRLPAMYRSPIAHGFCMMIRRTVINEIGLFDDIYGKGYGEENDFCMRALKHGYTCAVANRAFVFHFKGKSFTSSQRDKLVAKNEKILDARYPDYRRLVSDYVGQLDPLEWKVSRTGLRPKLSALTFPSLIQRLKGR